MVTIEPKANIMNRRSRPINKGDQHPIIIAAENLAATPAKKPAGETALNRLDGGKRWGLRGTRRPPLQGWTPFHSPHARVFSATPWPPPAPGPLRSPSAGRPTPFPPSLNARPPMGLVARQTTPDRRGRGHRHVPPRVGPCL